MMGDIKQKRIVDRLLEKTRAGDLEWQEGLHHHSFQVSFRTNSLLIRSVDRDTGSPDYVIHVLNDDGDIVDTFSDVDLDADEPKVEGKLVWYPKMDELYTLARRTALGSDKVLTEILRELDEDLPF